MSGTQTDPVSAPTAPTQAKLVEAIEAVERLKTAIQSATDLHHQLEGSQKTRLEALQKDYGVSTLEEALKLEQQMLTTLAADEQALVEQVADLSREFQF